MERITESKEQKLKMSDLAGAWALTDKETKEMRSNLKDGWTNWSKNLNKKLEKWNSK